MNSNIAHGICFEQLESCAGHTILRCEVEEEAGNFVECLKKREERGMIRIIAHEEVFE
jgi:hypothetical protein